MCGSRCRSRASPCPEPAAAEVPEEPEQHEDDDDDLDDSHADLLAGWPDYERPPSPTGSNTADAVRATTKKLEKNRLLGAYLARLDDADLVIAGRLFAGAPFPRKDERVLSVGWSTLSDVLLERSGMNGVAMAASYQRHADLGDVAHDLIAESPRDGEPLTLADVAASFDGIAAVRGTNNKRDLVRGAAAPRRRRRGAVHREDRLRRDAHRPSRGPARRRHRARLRTRARGGRAREHAHRRHRRGRAARQARNARRADARALQSRSA